MVMATAATVQVLLRHRFGWARLREVNDRGSVMPQQLHRKWRVQGRERTDQLVCYTGYEGMSGPLSWGIQSGRFVLRNQRGGRFQLCCRSLRCKGYGLCDPVTGLCACNPGFTASNCDVKLTCPNDWKSDGICAFRECMCGPSYTGEMQRKPINDSNCTWIYAAVYVPWYLRIVKKKQTGYKATVPS